MSGQWVRRGLIAAAAGGLLASGPAASAAPAAEDVTGPGNHAVIVPADTAAVLKRADELCERLFSYDYTTIDQYDDLVEELTVGKAAEQLDELVDAVAAQVVSQQAVLKSTVAESAVRYLTEDDARVLVYLDQSSTSTASGQETQSGAMLLVGLKRVDGEWLVADVETYGDK
jgi:Mce-associated membrane protein